MGILAALLWAIALPRVDPADFSDIGLVSALPMAGYAALVLVTVAFVAALREQPLRPLLLVFLLSLLLFMVYGVTAVAEGTTRFNAAWRHTGLMDHIGRTGRIESGFDAYFDWPGFFILGAFVSRVAGVSNLLGYAQWVSVLLNAMYLLPLFVIARSSTSDPRIPWLTSFIFLLTNWVGQDYLSPQGFNFFLALCLIAILLRWFRVVSPGAHVIWRMPGLGWGWRRVPRRLRDGLRPENIENAPSSKRQRIALLVIWLAVFAVIDGSHQLTPFGALFAVSGIVVLNRCSVRWLPVGMVAMIAAWLYFGASAFLASQGQSIVGGAGDVNSSVARTATDRVSGTPGHLFVAQANVVYSTTVWGLAALGGLRLVLVRKSRDTVGAAIDGRRDVVTTAALALAPFPLIALQSYGGEMFLRIYFFALPFMALLIAALLLPSRTNGRSVWNFAATSLVSLALLGGLLLCRYGNEQINYFSRDEVAAADHLYDVAEPGSWLASVNWVVPLRYRGYTTYRYTPLNNLLSEVAPDLAVGSTLDPATTDQIADALAALAAGEPFYLYVSRAQEAANHLFGYSAISPQALADALEASGRFRLIYANDDTRILQLVDPPPRATT